MPDSINDVEENIFDTSDWSTHVESDHRQFKLTKWFKPPSTQPKLTEFLPGLKPRERVPHFIKPKPKRAAHEVDLLSQFDQRIVNRQTEHPEHQGIQKHSKRRRLDMSQLQTVARPCKQWVEVLADHTPSSNVAIDSEASLIGPMPPDDLTDMKYTPIETGHAVGGWKALSREELDLLDETELERRPSAAETPSSSKKEDLPWEPEEVAWIELWHTMVIIEASKAPIELPKSSWMCEDFNAFFAGMVLYDYNEEELPPHPGRKDRGINTKKYRCCPKLLGRLKGLQEQNKNAPFHKTIRPRITPECLQMFIDRKFELGLLFQKNGVWTWDEAFHPRLERAVALAAEGLTERDIDGDGLEAEEAKKKIKYLHPHQKDLNIDYSFLEREQIDARDFATHLPPPVPQTVTEDYVALRQEISNPGEPIDMREVGFGASRAVPNPIDLSSAPTLDSPTMEAVPPSSLRREGDTLAQEQTSRAGPAPSSAAAQAPQRELTGAEKLLVLALGPQVLENQRSGGQFGE